MRSAADRLANAGAFVVAVVIVTAAIGLAYVRSAAWVAWRLIVVAAFAIASVIGLAASLLALPLLLIFIVLLGERRP